MEACQLLGRCGALERALTAVERSTMTAMLESNLLPVSLCKAYDVVIMLLGMYTEDILTEGHSNTCSKKFTTVLLMMGR